jgi:hypothetical protein
MVKIIDNGRQRRGIAGKIGRTSSTTVRSSEIYYQASNGQTIHAGSDDNNDNDNKNVLRFSDSSCANSLAENEKPVQLQVALHASFKDMATLESNVKIDPVEPPDDVQKAHASNNADSRSIERKLKSADRGIACDEKPLSKGGGTTTTHTVPQLHESAPTEISKSFSLSFDRDEGDDDWSMSHNNEPFQLRSEAKDEQAQRSNAHSSLAKTVAAQLLGLAEIDSSRSLDLLSASGITDGLGATSQSRPNDTRLPNVVANKDDQQKSDRLRCDGSMNYRLAAAEVDSNNHGEESPPNFAASQTNRLAQLEEELACLRKSARHQHALERQRHQAEICALHTQHANAMETLCENHNRTVAELKNQIALLRGDNDTLVQMKMEAERKMLEWDRVKQLEHLISTGDSTITTLPRKGTGKKWAKRTLLQDDPEPPVHVDPVAMTEQAGREESSALSTFVTYQGQIILPSLQRRRRRSNSRYVVRSPAFSS